MCKTTSKLINIGFDIYLCTVCRTNGIKNKSVVPEKTIKYSRVQEKS